MSVTDTDQIPELDEDSKYCPTCGQAIEVAWSEDQQSLELTAPGIQRELANALERTCTEMGWAIRTQKGVTFNHVASALLVRLTSGTG